MTRKTNSTLVYSTEHGRVCPGCGMPRTKCACSKKQTQTVPKGDGIVRVSLDKKGRKGKGVTIISGLSLDPAGLKDIAKKLKQKCGSGGTVKDGTIEIQGDHRGAMMTELESRGYRVKRSGG